MRGITKLFGQVGRRGPFGLTALVILAGPLIFAAPVFALDATLSGKVTSSSDNESIANVNLGLLSQSTGTFVGFGTTNATGDYAITVPTGAYTLFALPPSGSGYQTKSMSIDLSSSQVLNITLDPIPAIQTFSGTLKDQNGNSLGDTAGGLVRLKHAVTASEYTGGVDASTGAFSVEAPAGQYGLSTEVYKNGFKAIVTGSDRIDLNADTTQDLVVRFVDFELQIFNADGTPAEVTLVLRSQTADGPQLLPDYQTSARWDSLPFLNTNPIDGRGTLSFLPGEQCEYEVWVMGLNDPTTRLMVLTGSCTDADGSRVVHLPSTEVPTIPQNLSAPSPTIVSPALTWDAVSEADSYKIFRNGEEIDVANDTTYTDDSLTADGTYDYTVAACNEAGCGDQSAAATVVYDTEAPALGTPVWSANPIAVENDTTLTVGVTDNLAGVAEGEYFIGSDPGEGEGIAMDLTNGELTAALGAGLPIGEHVVSIRAKDNAGNWSAVTTATLTIEDPTPPAVTYELSAQPDAAGWYTNPVTLTWSVGDPESDITEQDGCETIVHEADTNVVTYTCTASSAGGTTNESVTLKYDATGPVLDTPEWSANPQDVGSDTTLTVPVSDQTSGVAAGEYFIGSDHGEGNGIAMNYNGTDLTATFGANLTPGVYTVGIRARDNAGNWSQVTTEELVIQDVTPPVVSYVLSTAPNANGWFNSDVTIDWQATDPAPSSGTPSDPPNTLAAIEGANVTYTSAPSCDPAGNCATGSVQLSIDKINPTIGTPTMSGIITIPFLNISFLFGNTTNITATVGDNLSGVVYAEYYFDTDPGQGSATAMNLSSNPTTNGMATVTVNVSGLGSGQHTLYVRSQDASGRWSTVATRTFIRL